MGSLLLSSESWCAQDFVCALQDWSLFPPVIWKSCNQIPLSFKVSFPRDPQSLLCIPRLGNLTWGSEPSQQWQSFFGIVVLQSVRHAPDGCGIWFYPGCTSPTVSLQHLLCFRTWGIFFFLGGFEHPPSFPCGSAGKESTCNAGDLGLIPELGRSPGEGKGYPLWYSGLENNMDCIVQGSQRVDTTEWLSVYCQHPPVNGSSTASCNFSLLTAEDEHMSFYFASWIGSLYFFIEPVCALICNEMKILICKRGNDST